MSILVRIVPKSIQKLLFRGVKEQLRAHRRIVESKIPKNNFLEKHLSNTKILTDRQSMLSQLPKGGVVAELGVDEGDFSSMILEICSPDRLHLVDYWGTKRYNLDKRKSVETKFKEEILSGKVELNIGSSLEVVENYPDEYFDWIYLDTGHTYELTAQELLAYYRKVKTGGFIAGHDFTRWNRAGLSRFGVMEAVSEFCNNYDWELVFITVEIDQNPSFAIRKLAI